eukprot:2097879-Pleurochrysis_carterae.AAC.1
MRVPRRARLAEVKSAGFLPLSLVVLFVALGCENSVVRRPRSAMREHAAEGGQEREGRGSGRGVTAPLRGTCTGAGA